MEDEFLEDGYDRNVTGAWFSGVMTEVLLLTISRVRHDGCN
jgi:hypothetical protein